MLAMDRFSYILVAPEEFDVLCHKAGVDPMDFTLKTLSDMPLGNVRHIMFSSGVSQGVVNRINRAIGELGEGLEY